MAQARPAGIYGDVGDPEFLEHLPLRRSAWVVVAIPAHPQTISHHDFRLSLLQSLRRAGFAGRVALTGADGADREHLLLAGTDLVISPFEDAAARAVERIADAPPERTGGASAPAGRAMPPPSVARG